MIEATAKSVSNGLGVLIGLGLKPIRYFIDSHFRDHVIPVEGSAIYSDLYFFVEHSGIYTGHGKISNIVVDSLLTADSTVKLSDARDFTEKSKLGRKIYVSCKGSSAVGNQSIANTAYSHVGDKCFYGLVFSNCHSFSTKCLAQDFVSNLTPSFDINFVKFTAMRVLGASKWKLWDWDNTAKDTPEPNWDEINQQLKRQPLTPKYREQLQKEIEQALDYEQEISDEEIPNDVLNKLKIFRGTLQKLSAKYDEMAKFLALCPNAGFNYEQLEQLSKQGIDFISLAKEMQQNAQIKELVKKMGRDYISEDKKRQIKIPQASKNEVHGTHRSDDLMRLLPSELVNLEDEELEMLFYAKLLEKNLITYQLSGVTHITQDESYQQPKTSGPVVACLDTSGSMGGQTLLKAKALLFAIANILKQEKRSLYVVLFGSTGQLKEYRLDGEEDLAGLLQFLQNGFNGGTDFESPLQRAIDIIQAQEDYIKADILMLSDGDCQLSSSFADKFKTQKQKLDCMVYSLLCDGKRVTDNFSDEIVVL